MPVRSWEPLDCRWFMYVLFIFSYLFLICFKFDRLFSQFNGFILCLICIFYSRLYGMSILEGELLPMIAYIQVIWPLVGSVLSEKSHFKNVSVYIHNMPLFWLRWLVSDECFIICFKINIKSLFWMKIFLSLQPLDGVNFPKNVYGEIVYGIRCNGRRLMVLWCNGVTCGREWCAWMVYDI